MHYVGNVCDYDHKPATPDCPFPVPGTATLPLEEDPSLLSGSSITSPDGTPGSASARQCQHDAAFFANPDYEAVIDAQRWEIEQRNINQGIIDEGQGE